MNEDDTPTWQADLAEVRRRSAAEDVAGLRAALEHSRGEVRREALIGLAALAPDGLDETLIAALADRAQAVRRTAAGLLEARGEAAVPWLLEQLSQHRLAGHCAGALALSKAGRRALSNLPDRGYRALCAALAEADRPWRQLSHLLNCLAGCTGTEPLEVLARFVDHESALVRTTAGRALYLRWDPRAVPWALAERPLWLRQDVERIDWLGECGNPQALALLRRLASFWSWSVSPDVKAAARQAIAELEAREAHVPAGAISLADRRARPSEAALSLWQEDDAETG